MPPIEDSLRKIFFFVYLGFSAYLFWAYVSLPVLRLELLLRVPFVSDLFILAGAELFFGFAIGMLLGPIVGSKKRSDPVLKKVTAALVYYIVVLAVLAVAANYLIFNSPYSPHLDLAPFSIALVSLFLLKNILFIMWDRKPETINKRFKEIYGSEFLALIFTLFIGFTLPFLIVSIYYFILAMISLKGFDFWVHSFRGN